MIPEQQRALVLHEYAGPSAMSLENIPVLPPQQGEVLVKIAVSPINPSDLGFLQGGYGFRKPLPCVPGFEASGTIVAVGAGVDEARIGQRVACISEEHDEGTWAQYMRIHADTCLPVDAAIDQEQASMLIVNPLTVWALFERAAGSSAIIQTAAASALGRMVIRFAPQRGVTLINIVRRDEQIDELHQLGAEYVLNSGAPDFEERLRRLAYDFNARVAFDTVAGDLGTHLLHLMPDGSRLIVYGRRGGPDVSVSAVDLIFKAKTVEGFWLPLWMAADSERLATAWREVQSNMAVFKTAVRARYALEDVGQAIAEYVRQMSGGKLLLTP